MRSTSRERRGCAPYVGWLIITSAACARGRVTTVLSTAHGNGFVIDREALFGFVPEPLPDKPPSRVL